MGRPCRRPPIGHSEELICQDLSEDRSTLSRMGDRWLPEFLTDRIFHSWFSVHTCFKVYNRYVLPCLSHWWVMNWVVMKLISIVPHVSSAPSTPIFTLIGNYCFSTCYTNSASTCRQKKQNDHEKMATFEVSRTSRQDRVGFSSCLDLHMHHCHGQCIQFPIFHFQALICSGWRDFRTAVPLGTYSLQFQVICPENGNTALIFL